MIRDRTLVIAKGPSLFGANLGLVIERFRFLASSQTLSPFSKGLKLQWFLDNMTWRASSYKARASSQAALRAFRQSSTVGIEVSEMTMGRAWGSYPIMR